MHPGVALECDESPFSSPTETVLGMLSSLGAPRWMWGVHPIQLAREENKKVEEGREGRIAPLSPSCRLGYWSVPALRLRLAPAALPGVRPQHSVCSHTTPLAWSTACRQQRGLLGHHYSVSQSLTRKLCRALTATWLANCPLYPLQVHRSSFEVWLQRSLTFLICI